jgi:RHS repeat-associated protein
VVTTSQGSTTTEYTFDGDGRLVRKTISGVGTTTYVYDGQGRQIGLTKPNDSPQWSAYGLGLLGYASVQEAGNSGGYPWRFFIADGHGDIRLVTKWHGGVEAQYKYDAFGQVRWGYQPQGDDFTFGGGTHAEGGLSHMGARYYDPQTGRFISRDPLAGYAGTQSLNRYVFGLNNPTRYSDPSGLCPMCAFGVVVVVAVAAEIWWINNPDVQRAIGEITGTSVRTVPTTYPSKSEGKQKGEGDISLPSEEEARAEAYRRWGVKWPPDPGLEPEETRIPGKNPNLLGPKGEPATEVTAITEDGRVVTIPHHRNGHLFTDVDPPVYEPPHFEGPHGEHIFYPP